MTEVPLAAVAAFAADGRVWRAYGHLIAAGAGTLLAVPLTAVGGDLRGVVDGCPVPWEEVLALLDAPVRDAQPVLPDSTLFGKAPAVLAITPFDWISDVISPFHGGRTSAVRLIHASGIRYAHV